MKKILFQTTLVLLAAGNNLNALPCPPTNAREEVLQALCAFNEPDPRLECDKSKVTFSGTVQENSVSCQFTCTDPENSHNFSVACTSSNARR